MRPNRFAKYVLTCAFVTACAGLTFCDRGAIGQTTGSTDQTIEIRNCYVRFYRAASLATDRPGVIAELPFDEGNTIREGDLVVRLRDDVAVANLALATERAASEAAVHMAEKEAAAAAVEFHSHERANEVKGSVVPGSIVDRSRLVKEAREAAVIRAQDEVKLNARAKEQAEAELNSYRIISQQNGVVTHVYKRVGEAVQQGESILDIVDPTVARIEGELEISQTRLLRVGMPVEVRLDFEDAELPIEQEVFVGTIGFIDVSASVGLHEVRIWAEVQNRDGILLDNLPARMTVHLNESR